MPWVFVSQGIEKLVAPRLADVTPCSSVAELCSSERSRPPAWLELWWSVQGWLSCRRLLVTVPLLALQGGHITFDPPLPTRKQVCAPHPAPLHELCVFQDHVPEPLHSLVCTGAHHPSFAPAALHFESPSDSPNDVQPAASSAWIVKVVHDLQENQCSCLASAPFQPVSGRCNFI